MRAAFLAATVAGLLLAACAFQPSATPKPSGIAGQRALVLGGGGPTGHAWEAGMLKGLRDAGIDVSAADLIVGTSAGAILGTELRSGKSIEDIYAEELGRNQAIRFRGARRPTSSTFRTPTACGRVR